MRKGDRWKRGEGGRRTPLKAMFLLDFFTVRILARGASQNFRHIGR